MPKPGSSLEDAREQKFSSAVTEYGDLNPSEGIQVMSIDWDGDFKEDDDGGMFFKDGFEYQAMIQFLIDPNGKYDTDYIIKNGEYILDGSRIKVTVNGKPAHVQNSTPYVIYMDIQFLIGSGGKGSDRELASGKAYQSSVNYALCDNLLDEELLGSDYTKPVTQLQLRSLAVRLAEELVGKKIKIEKKVEGKYNDAITFSTIAPVERVWVVGPRLGGMSEYLPVKEPVTGQTLYVKANCFRPVRKYVFKSEKTTLREGEFKNYMDGQYIWYRWN